MIRDGKTRRHKRTVTVEAENEYEIVDALDRVRAPVMFDIFVRTMKANKRKLINDLKKTDFFDSKGHDICYEEYFDNKSTEDVCKYLS